MCQRGEGEAAVEAAPSGARASSYMRLTVRDTGCGIAPEVREHLFEPFFTTKEVGRGTGLGLATVHGIVEQHRGWVDVRSELGRGSTFFVYLPRAGSARSAERMVAPPRITGGAETILLGEDEPAMRHLAAAMLRQLGYRVWVASDGPAALRLWAEHAGEIDLLVTDMIMPEGLTGLELATRLRAASPALKVIVISGYTEEILKADQLSAAGATLLPKPFEFEAFAAAVRKALD